MKKTILLFTLLILTILTFGQTLPNNSFETWESNPFPSYEEPPPWNTANPFTALAGAVSVTKSEDAFSGEFAAQLETIEINVGQTFQAPGLLTFADFNIDLVSLDFSFNGGLFLQDRVTKLMGKYKYTPAENDSASVLIYCFSHPEGEELDTIGLGVTYLHDAEEWTDFSVDMFYLSPSTPDTFNVLIMSTGTFEIGNMPPGSIMLVDDITIETTVSTPENIAVKQATIYPVPANDRLTFELDESNEYTLSIFDINGRLMEEIKFDGNYKVANTSNLSKGNYTYRILDNKGLRYAGSFVK